MLGCIGLIDCYWQKGEYYLWFLEEESSRRFSSMWRWIGWRCPLCSRLQGEDGLNAPVLRYSWGERLAPHTCVHVLVHVHVCVLGWWKMGGVPWSENTSDTTWAVEKVRDGRYISCISIRESHHRGACLNQWSQLERERIKRIFLLISETCKPVICITPVLQLQIQYKISKIT